MRYMILIFSNEAEDDFSPEAMQPWTELEAAAQEAGVWVDGAPLQPTATATVVRLAGEKPVFTDGPYAETKEQLGGYLIFECRDLDEALTWAARVPTAKHGAVEVRPFMTFDQA